MKNPRLEKASWIAAIVGTIWMVGVFFVPTDSSSPLPSSYADDNRGGVKIDRGGKAGDITIHNYPAPSPVGPLPDAVSERISLHAERYTNLRRLGERLLADYLLVQLHPDGSFDIIQSKTPGLNLVIPESILLKIQGKWIIEESEITQNPNRVKFRFSKIAEFNGRVLLQVDF